MTIGERKLPNKIPNLNQILFNGLKIDEFNKPKIKKIIAQILILPSLNNKYNEIIKKNTKKTNPKLLLKLILIIVFSILINYNYAYYLFSIY